MAKIDLGKSAARALYGGEPTVCARGNRVQDFPHGFKKGALGAFPIRSVISVIYERTKEKRQSSKVDTQPIRLYTHRDSTEKADDTEADGSGGERKPREDIATRKARARRQGRTTPQDASKT